MNCEQAMEWMSVMLDGELEQQQADALRAHLETCPDCRRLMEAMEGLEQKVSALREPAPEGLKRGVLYRIDQATGKAKKPKLNRWFGPGAAIGAVAALLVLLVGLGVFPLGGKATQAGNAASPMDTAAGGQYECAPETQAPQADWEDAYGSPESDAVEHRNPIQGGKDDLSNEVPAVPAETAAEAPTSDDYYLSGGKSEQRGASLAVTEPLRESCAKLSAAEDAMVLLYTEFTPESLFALLEAEAPALYKLTAELEPQESEGLIRYETDCGTALAIQEWLLENLPQSEIMSGAAQEAETRLRIRMEELDPGSGSLYRIITWSPPDHPVKWPETWPEGWALRLRTEENWSLFFPAEDYVPSSDNPAWLVFPANR